VRRLGFLFRLLAVWRSSCVSCIGVCRWSCGFSGRVPWAAVGFACRGACCRACCDARPLLSLLCVARWLSVSWSVWSVLRFCDFVCLGRRLFVRRCCVRSVSFWLGVFHVAVSLGLSCRCLLSASCVVVGGFARGFASSPLLCSLLVVVLSSSLLCLSCVLVPSARALPCAPLRPSVLSRGCALAALLCWLRSAPPPPRGGERRCVE